MPGMFLPKSSGQLGVKRNIRVEWYGRFPFISGVLEVCPPKLVATQFRCLVALLPMIASEHHFRYQKQFFR